MIRTSRVLSPDGAWPERWLSGMIENGKSWPGYDMVVHEKSIFLSPLFMIGPSLSEASVRRSTSPLS